jgi:starch-binding outer membrane protein, SusD/RagB family
MNNTYLNHRITVCLLFVVVTMLSCKKLIEIPSAPPSQLSTDKVFADSVNTLGAIAGVYTNFGNSSMSSDPTTGSGLVTVSTALSGDELINNNDYSPYMLFYKNALLANNGVVADLWADAYTNIYQVNACLEGVKGSTGLSQSMKDQVTGEMEVVRAFYYFHLANLFNSVPLVTSTDYRQATILSNASPDAMYSQMIGDLTDAQQKLGAMYPTKGHIRPNRYAAVALLAKVFLYRQQWQKALDAASTVINSGAYQLEGSISNVFLDGSSEAIWQLPANSFQFQTKEAYLFTPIPNVTIPDYLVSKELLNAFEPDDMRRQQWIGIDTVNVDGVNAVYYYPAKYKNVAAGPTTEDYMILRYADLLLIRAEANARLNNLSAALADLNSVRRRAGLPDSKAISQADVLNAILQERRVELFCEWGNRWYDLKRTGTINTVLGGLKSGWKPEAALYPIPQSELQRSPNLKQNPGY